MTEEVRGSQDYINEFAVVSETGFIRVEGPFEVSLGGTRRSIHIPTDRDDYSHPGRGPMYLLDDSLIGDGVALVADGEIVGGGLVEDVYTLDEEGEKHVVVQQYAGDIDGE